MLSTFWLRDFFRKKYLDHKQIAKGDGCQFLRVIIDSQLSLAGHTYCRQENELERIWNFMRSLKCYQAVHSFII